MHYRSVYCIVLCNLIFVVYEQKIVVLQPGLKLKSNIHQGNENLIRKYRTCHENNVYNAKNINGPKNRLNFCGEM